MSEQTPRHGGKNVFRTIAALSTAAILLGSSFYAAQAGGAGLGQYEDDGDESGTAKTVGIIVGTGLGVMLIANAIDRDRDDDESSADKAKSAKSGKVEQVRVVPSRSQLGEGDSTIVQVQARYAGSTTWQNVTESASVRLVSGGMTQVDGSKNAFAVPYGSSVVSGPATVEASFGGQSATAQVSVN